MSTVFMQIKGFKGNATAANYKDWIEIDSLDFGANRTLKMDIGNLSERNQGSLVINRMTLIKYMDNASNDLFMAMCNAGAFSQVEIHLCRGDSTLTPYAKVILDKVMVAKHYTETLMDAKPLEEIELAFTKIQRTYVALDASNKSQSPNTVGYDLEVGKAV